MSQKMRVAKSIKKTTSRLIGSFRIIYFSLWQEENIRSSSVSIPLYCIIRYPKLTRLWTSHNQCSVPASATVISLESSLTSQSASLHRRQFWTNHILGIEAYIFPLWILTKRRRSDKSNSCLFRRNLKKRLPASARYYIVGIIHIQPTSQPVYCINWYAIISLRLILLHKRHSRII